MEFINRMRHASPHQVFRMTLAAAAMLWAGTKGAGAAIIHTDLAASPLTVPSSLEGIYLNLVTGATSTTAVPVAGWDFNPYNNGPGLTFYSPVLIAGQGTLISGSTAAQSLLGGELIGGSGLYQSAQVSGTDFRLVSGRYAGLRFYNEATSQLNYGWAKLSTTATTGFPAAILGYAYEDSGAAIVAGAIPEPSALGLLITSAIGLIGRRRRSRWKYLQASLPNPDGRVPDHSVSFPCHHRLHHGQERFRHGRSSGISQDDIAEKMLKVAGDPSIQIDPWNPRRAEE